MVRIITWNINSVRIRIPIIEKVCELIKPDVICLQETKVVNDAFPRKSFEALGFHYQMINGIPAYNGTAILSKVPFVHSDFMNFCDKEDGRHCSVTLDNGIHIHNYYVPAGGDIPNPNENIKFRHKLDFLYSLQNKWKLRKDTFSEPVVLLGDFNIAPLETDVWSHKQLLNVVSHTPIEVENLIKWQSTHGWIDTLRYFIPPEEKLYSWWSYRAKDHLKSNRGRRLDHIWASPFLEKALTNAFIFPDTRSWEKTSDHVPVILDIDEKLI